MTARILGYFSVLVSRNADWEVFEFIEVYLLQLLINYSFNTQLRHASCRRKLSRL